MRFLFAKALFLVSFFSFSQNETIDSYDLFNRTKVRNPEKSIFTNYLSDGSIDLATGKFGITIPFFTIQNEYINIPVGIVYSTSGIKVAEVSSDIGMGWDLIGEGSVTRIKNGQPDEISNPMTVFEDPLTDSWAQHNLYTGKRSAPGFNLDNNIPSIPNSFLRYKVDLQQLTLTRNLHIHKQGQSPII